MKGKRVKIEKRVVLWLLAALALLSGGMAKAQGVQTLWGWGSNGRGQLGDGTLTDRYTPTKASGLTGVTAVAFGWEHALAVKSDGTVWAWGGNGYSQLGIGTNDYDPHPNPVRVPGLRGMTGVAGGWYHSLAVKQDGTVWGWGQNGSGQLGDGTNTDRKVPVQVVGPNGQGFLTGVIAVAASSLCSLAVKQDGTVWGWGYNGYGQLGDGTNISRNTPVQVAGLTGAAAVSAGLYHVLAVKQDGTVWTWGYNGYGQLGDGTGNNRATPVQVVGPNGQGFLTGAVAVAAGGYHCVVVKQDGTVWTWGYNRYGQIGDGMYTDRPTPVQVSGLMGVTAVVGGWYCSLALAPATSLSGVLTLQGIAPAVVRIIAFAFHSQDGSGDFTLPAAVGSDGAVTLGGLPQKSYALHIKGSSYLAVNRGADLTHGSVAGLTATLLPGDINNDNKINITDLGLLADSFNKSSWQAGYNPNADLNGDNGVNIIDLGLLADSFGKQGDP
jgi:hypothetical protein